MSLPEVGKLIEGPAFRDAIHVAIAPVVAAHGVCPGDPVGLVPGSSDTVCSAEPSVGIVDPFLEEPVEAGKRFYLFLYPNTVTSLRHSWTHPAFAAKPAK